MQRRCRESLLRRRTERLYLKLPAAQRQQPVKCRLASQFAHGGMSDCAGLDVNPPAYFWITNFEDGRMPAVAFHLNDFLQVHLP